MTSKSRREFLKKTAYVAPAVLTLNAAPALARNGSPGNQRTHRDNGVGNGPDSLPRGLENNGKSYLDNDDVSGIPGNPQNRGGPNS